MHKLQEFVAEHAEKVKSQNQVYLNFITSVETSKFSKLQHIDEFYKDLQDVKSYFKSFEL